MRIINCSGFGNTGCTAQTDFLSDHTGVSGILKPYHELGVLKCAYSFGGILLSIIQKWKHTPTKIELKKSLMGIDPKGRLPMSEGARMHLELRALLAQRTPNYENIVDNAISRLPDQYAKMDLTTLIFYMRNAVGEYIFGLSKNLKTGHFAASEYDAQTSVLGFKNDPPGAYPIFASLLKGGLSSAIIRDPRDTTYDFNRHYGLGHSMDTVKNHCTHFNAQLNSARQQINQFENHIQPFYKVIDFENLIISEDFRNTYRDHMVGNRERVRHTFDPKKSKVNIGHHTNMLPEYIKYVEDTCMENYLSFRNFCKERDLLLE